MEGVKAEFPPNWLTVGYPGQSLKTPEYLAFVKKYEDAYHKPPQWAGTVGYIYARMLLQAISDAPAINREAIAKQLAVTSIDSPFGHISMRSIDNRSDMGSWIGVADYSSGELNLRDAERYDVNKLSPPDDWIRAQRENGNKKPK